MRTSIPFFILLSVIFFQFACRNLPKSGASVNADPAIVDLPFDLGVLLSNNRVKYKKWSPEELPKDQQANGIKFYHGGVLIQPKQSLHSTDTIYMPDVTGIPREKLQTKTIAEPYVEWSRLVAIPAESRTCSLGNKSIKTISFCQEIRYEVAPASRGTQTFYVLNPKYASEYPDGLPQKIKVYRHLQVGDTKAVSWKEWGNMNKEDYFYEEIPAGYYSTGCTEDYDSTCKILQVQQVLVNKDYDLELTGILDVKTKEMLSKYAKDNGLPIPQNGNFLLWFPELEEK